MNEFSRALNEIFEGMFSWQGVAIAVVGTVIFLLYFFAIWLPAQDPLHDAPGQEEERGEGE